MRRQKTTFHFNEETGFCLCTIKIRGNQYIGVAQCHPDDMDMVNQKTGENIAYHRAVMEMLRDERKRLQHELAGLKGLYYSMNNSPLFNPKSYEAKSLYRQISFREDDISSVNDLIKEIQRYINGYISDKDEFYQKIRKNRKTEIQG